MQPLVSVIVTTYNRKQFLNETICSILNQTFTDFELIVVDNFSDYDFISFIGTFNDKRIIPYQNVNNGLIALNRNFGIKQSKGKYLAFCDDDDTWLADKLKKQIRVMNQYPETEKLLVHTNCECFGPSIENYFTKKKEIASINDFVFGNDITLSSTLIFRPEAIFFDESQELKATEDFFLWLNLISNNYKIILIKEPLVKYYVANSSISRGYKEYMHLKFLVCLLLIMLRYPDNRIKTIDLIRSAIIQLLKFNIKKIFISGK